MHNGDLTVHMESLLEAIAVRATQTTFLQPPWNITSLNLFFGHTQGQQAHRLQMCVCCLAYGKVPT